MTSTAAHGVRLRFGAGLPVITDGGISSELVRRGFVLPAQLGSAAAVREVPDMLVEIHAAYVAAGVHIIRANTARTTPRVLRRVGYEYRAASLTARAVELAIQAVQDSALGIAVGGTVMPLEGRENPEGTPEQNVLIDEHGSQAQRIAAAGCDLIFIESMPTMREAIAATAAAVSTGLPTYTSFAVGSDNRLLSGEDLPEAVHAVREVGAEVVLVNGNATMGDCERAAAIVAQGGAAFGALADLPPRIGVDKLVALMQRLVARGAWIIGGCCNVSPTEIAAITHAVDPTHGQDIDAESM
ncbi:MAG: homocysteine S-methyltransferase family protein [Sandaracinaceae bacterium]|nr:homocysteine S-methyltransferase family protein [Sandaracinaceae bacterium]